ncbi:MAG TPA: hypothetical protein PK177_12050 [Burkholderiaceae bacterium]|nr:hypothetical protein [Burkholderiaceae bacterium]
MPGSAFDASGPPDGDYARYLERLSGGDAKGGGGGGIDAPPSAEHRWGHAAADDEIEGRGSGLSACPGPEPGFGAPGFGAPGSGYGAAGNPATASTTISSPAGEPAPRPRRALHVLALALILAGVAVIALAALPPDPWFSTPLPGFLLLIAGLHLRRVARRGGTRRSGARRSRIQREQAIWIGRPDRSGLPDRRDPYSGP